MAINHGEQSMKRLMTFFTGLVLSQVVLAITPAEDIAATINLNGFACGNTVSNINETVDGNGNKTITATCADGKRYQVKITSNGRVSVAPQ